MDRIYEHCRTSHSSWTPSTQYHNGHSTPAAGEGLPSEQWLIKEEDRPEHTQQSFINEGAYDRDQIEIHTGAIRNIANALNTCPACSVCAPTAYLVGLTDTYS
jgi:hypothetical protein